MWKLALFVSLALLVSADWSVEQSSFLRPLSVDPEECDYLTEVCGPITSVDFFELQDKKFAFVGTGNSSINLNLIHFFKDLEFKF